MINKKIFKFSVLSLIIILSFSFLGINEGQASKRRFSMSYLYFGCPETHINLVNQTNGALDVIAPNYFDLNEDGSLKITTKFSTKFINEMKKKNIKVVPFLSNHWSREIGRKALENREELSTQIADVINDFDLDGVNVDIENVSHEDRENYTDFVKLLREKIPQDKEVSVAVAANPRNFKLGWHGSYDYAELAKYADYLMIMAYDESYYGSEPGPIASISFVEKSLQYALERVSSDKIVLGVPFYGRYWNHSESKGGRGIHLTVLDDLLNFFDAQTAYLQDSQSPLAIFEIEEDDEPYYIHDRKLAAGIYSVWYENEESIKAKLELVNKYNLKGAGSWSLGQELPSTWNYYMEALNDSSLDEDVEFSDIDNHWAKDDILSVQTKGWMKGYDNGIFAPDSSLTRAEATVTIVRAFNLEKQGEVVDGFDDVTGIHWAENEIHTAKEHGIINGIDEKNFAPNRPVSREEMAVLLNRILDLDVEIIDLRKPLFSDIQEERWSYESIFSMTFKGLMRGYEDGSFRPIDSITRGQMASLLNRMTKYIE